MIASKLVRGSLARALVGRKGVLAGQSALVTRAASLSPADVQLNTLPPIDHQVLMAFHRELFEKEEVRNNLAYCLSFAPTDESSDFARNFGKLFPDERMKKQLEYSENQLRQVIIPRNLDKRPLPETLQDALRPSRRAIVITEAKKPFRIFNVNKAWEDLCGYCHVESKGKTLGSLLRGPETDGLAATGLITQLLRGEEAGTTLTNYTKSGRRFRNRIVVRPLSNNGEITHFVGILQEVHDGL